MKCKAGFEVREDCGVPGHLKFSEQGASCRLRFLKRRLRTQNGTMLIIAKPSLELLEDRLVPSNLLVNGDFEGGNAGFTTQYTYSHGDIGPAASYDIVDNPAHSRPHDINPVSYGDHTTGSGLMMAVNGATTPNMLVWGETVAVEANSTFQFSAYISSWFAGAPAQLDVLFNGTSVGTMTAPSATGVWVPFSVSWNFGSATSAAIEIRNLSTADVGDDFALDDISLNPPTTTTIGPGHE